LLGALFVAGAVRLQHNPTPARAMALFRFSIIYLALLFAAVALDALVRIRP
jgi:heme O synthase-like polyprenyltransferase